MATRTVLQEMIELQFTRPGIDAPAAAVAAWQERRALMLEHIAAAGGDVDAERARQAARTAHRRARELAAA